MCLKHSYYLKIWNYPRQPSVRQRATLRVISPTHSLLIDSSITFSIFAQAKNGLWYWLKAYASHLAKEPVSRSLWARVFFVFKYLGNMCPASNHVLLWMRLYGFGRPLHQALISQNKRHRCAVEVLQRATLCWLCQDWNTSLRTIDNPEYLSKRTGRQPSRQKSVSQNMLALDQLYSYKDFHRTIQLRIHCYRRK